MTEQQNTKFVSDISPIDTLELAARILFYDPRLAIRAMRLLRRQQKAAKIRAAHKIAGIYVLRFPVYSITENCNLTCHSCYATVLQVASRWRMEIPVAGLPDIDDYAFEWD